MDYFERVESSAISAISAVMTILAWFQGRPNGDRRSTGTGRPIALGKTGDVGDPLRSPRGTQSNTTSRFPYFTLARQLVALLQALAVVVLRSRHAADREPNLRRCARFSQ
jgi:hypothetical protein